MKLGAAPASMSGGVEPDGAAPSPPRQRGLRRRTWLALGVVIAVAAGALIWITVHDSSKPSVSKADVGKIVDNKVGTAVNNLKNEPPPGVGIFSAVQKSMVVIESGGIGHSHDSALGSGVIINTQGQILTALHVVQGADAVQVRFADGTVSAAMIAGTDRKSTRLNSSHP